MALPSIDRIDELYYRPVGEDDAVRYNVVNAALERVRRDLGYLEITCAKYLPVAKEYSEKVRTRIAEQKLMPEGARELTQEERETSIAS